MRTSAGAVIPQRLEAGRRRAEREAALCRRYHRRRRRRRRPPHHCLLLRTRRETEKRGTRMRPVRTSSETWRTTWKDLLLAI